MRAIHHKLGCRCAMISSPVQCRPCPGKCSSTHEDRLSNISRVVLLGFGRRHALHWLIGLLATLLSLPWSLPACALPAMAVLLTGIGICYRMLQQCAYSIRFICSGLQIPATRYHTPCEIPGLQACRGAVRAVLRLCSWLAIPPLPFCPIIASSNSTNQCHFVLPQSHKALCSAELLVLLDFREFCVCAGACRPLDVSSFLRYHLLRVGYVSAAMISQVPPHTTPAPTTTPLP